MIKKIKLRALTYLRNIYARIICPQVCFFCGEETGTGIPLCSKCLQKEITEPVLFRLKNPEKFCSSCGKILISEKEFCTDCRAKLREKENLRTEEREKTEKEDCAKHLLIQSDFLKKVYTIYPYKGRGGELLRLWKNQNMRGFAEIYASAIASLSVCSSAEESASLPFPVRLSVRVLFIRISSFGRAASIALRMA